MSPRKPKRLKLVEDSEESDKSDESRSDLRRQTRSRSKRNKNDSANSSSSDEEPDSDKSCKSLQPKRTPRSSSAKAERSLELQKLAQRRNRNPKVKKSLEFSSDDDEKYIEATRQMETEQEDYLSEPESEATESEESEYENDGFVANDSSEDSEAQFDPEALEDVIADLGRKSEKDQQLMDDYHMKVYEEKFSPKKKSPKKKVDKENEDPYIFKNLVGCWDPKKQEYTGLRAFATDPELEDIEIIKEFEVVDYDRDEGRMEKCVCGKEELVHLFYLKNRKKKLESDLIDYATSTCIVGSECVTTFNRVKHKSRDHLKGRQPIEKEFIKWAQDGIIGHFRKERQVKLKVHLKKSIKMRTCQEWTITIPSKIISEDFEGFCKQYNVPIKIKENGAIDIKVLVTPTVLTHLKKTYFYPETESLENDSRHKFYIRFKVDELGEHDDPPYPVRFYVYNLENPESKAFRSSEPTSGKDFLK